EPRGSNDMGGAGPCPLAQLGPAAMCAFARPSGAQRTLNAPKRSSAIDEVGKRLRHAPVDGPLERHDEIGEPLEPLPAPGVELGFLGGLRVRTVDLRFV